MFNKISKFLKWRNNILQVQPVTFLKPVYRMTHYRCKTSYEIYTEGGITITLYYQAILIKKKKKTHEVIIILRGHQKNQEDKKS